MDNPNDGKTPPYRFRAGNVEASADANSSTETPLGTSEYKETLLLLAKMMAIIFVCEAVIMALLAVIPLSSYWSILADPILLTLLGAPILYMLLVRPIKRSLEQRKRTERKLLEYQGKLKSLASKLALTEESERRRLATELHDRIGQNLILCKVKLDRLRIHGPEVDLEQTVSDICDDLREIIQRSRDLIFDLSYPVLYDLGLEAALEEWLSEKIRQKHNIETEFEDDGLPKPLDDDVRTVLFRNARELTANLLEHDGTTKIRVSVRRIGGSLRIDVEGFDSGFDTAEISVSASKRAESGLLGIRERLEQLGGTIQISSQDGDTRISMTAPLKQSENE